MRAKPSLRCDIDELVAEISPKPDVQATIRKLPERQEKTRPTPALELGPGRVARRSPASAKPAVVEPLAPARYKVQFTASAEFHDKLARLRELMRSSVPDGDLAAIIEEAVTEKLERLESKRFGKIRAPKQGSAITKRGHGLPKKSLEKTDTSASSRHIPAAVKRAVRQRDGRQRTFVDSHGRRCTARDGLEFHHQQPFGRGGDHRPNNVYMICPAHNRYLAERDYGKEMMAWYRRPPSHVSKPAPVYYLGTN